MGNAYYWNAGFGGFSDFTNAKFDGEAYFGGAQFNRTAEFSRAKFNGSADFRETRFHGLLDLYAVDISKFIISWQSIEGDFVCDDITYLGLIKKFKENGQFEDADSCYYQYRQWHQSQKSWLEGSKIIDILACLSCGYGMYPLNVVYSLFVLIVLSGFLFWIGDGIKNESDLFSAGKVSLIDHWFYSLMVAIGIHTDFKPKGRFRYLVAVCRIFGLLLFALLITTLGHVFIR